jgi:hypothetical protein
VATAGSPALDRVLAAALADSTEKWLVSKGRLDYGPFSLAEVVAQIERGDLTGGDLVTDKDTGARTAVGSHPLLASMAEAARQRRDDARRAQAEVAVQRKDKKRGALLYVGIALGLAGVAAAVYLVIQSRGAAQREAIEGVAAIEGASLKVTVSMPKKASAPPRRAQPRPQGGAAAAQGSEDLALDLTDDGAGDEGAETLDMSRVYGVYSRYGAQLGGCLQSTGERAASIYINIDGKSGRVSFVRINGKTSGPLFSCLSGVLRNMKFPSINGPRTRAEFDISL